MIKETCGFLHLKRELLGKLVQIEQLFELLLCRLVKTVVLGQVRWGLDLCDVHFETLTEARSAY
jgi:hypothetical protein